MATSTAEAVLATRAAPHVPRGLAAGTLVATALVWGPYALWPGALWQPLAQTGAYVALFTLTATNPRLKVLLVRALQRWVINPVVRAGFVVGINPFGVALLETRGRVSGQPRRTPVGNGRRGTELWIIAEHGEAAGYVRNLRQDPHVRIRLRLGLRHRWVDGIATVRPDDDALARQRSIIAWHPLRALNAVNVRVLGADLLSVHVRLDLDGATARGGRAGG
ncbi:nitroreductase/quinone reductase family protein [Luteimicrobium sp. DT211]|uniref:nitroreductase/quinone reductase family protein n=1 Tax=Luteimicrobium sp. DT211 TaxID=3393412 RepID=UPI003CF76B16